MPPSLRLFYQTNKVVLGNPEASYEQLAQTATALGVPLSAQGLDHRFTRQAADYLKRLLEQAVHQVIAATPVAIPLLQRFNGVYLQDSTTIRLPDALAAEWSSNGGRCATNTQAALKLQVRFNLCDGALTHLDLQPGRAQDKTPPCRLRLCPPALCAWRILVIFRCPPWRHTMRKEFTG